MIQLHSEMLWLKIKIPGERTEYRGVPQLASLATAEAVELTFVRDILTNPNSALQLARFVLETPMLAGEENLRRTIAEASDELLAAAGNPDVFSAEEAKQAHEITFQLSNDFSSSVRAETAEAIEAWSRAA